jgi:tetratricopeptide (TPR) repeat protein
MKKRLFVLAATLSFLALSALPGPAQEGKTLIQQGDELYTGRADLSKAQEALEKYRAAYASKEDVYGACWRIARAHYWVGDHTPDKAEKKRIFEQGIYYAKKAVEFAPDKPEGHYWLGICYGVYGEAKGVLKSLSLVKPIKAAMNKVLELDPAYDDGGPDRVLGRVYHELPGFAGGSKKKSLEHLLRSKELGPRVGLTRIYLADTYLSLDEVEKAREELEFVLTMEPDPALGAETAEEKEMARKRLEGKEFRKDAPSIPI